MGVPYDSEEARKINREIFETIYYAAIDMSNKLAKEKGVYSTYEGSPFSEGKLQFDLWNEYSNVDLSDKFSGRWDWDSLKQRIKKHGMRNSLLTALMPTASTSQIMGSAAEAFEPVTSNVYTRRTLAGEFIVFNKYLTEELINRGLWTNKVKRALLKGRGSIQHIKDIP
jgi:ribonucleoside-diphosphate reductase alpha chain